MAKCERIREDPVSSKKWHTSHHGFDVLTEWSLRNWLLRIVAFD
jgi:hypothetical protein